MVNKVISPVSMVRQLPYHGWLGLSLIAIFWPLNWFLPGLRTHWGFFPLWLGYSLAVDGINLYRRGTSLLTRSPKMYLGLFLISAPVWWIFEFVNWRTQNWHYVGREFFSDLEYLLLASLSFSTVVPAVLGTAELYAGTRFIQRFRGGPVIKPDSLTTRTFYFAGMAMFALLLLWPLYFFPFMWLFVYFILAPVNVWLGNHSLSRWTRQGDWRPVIALFLGVLTCGFFWEFWNFFSYPKWVYTVPWFGFWHVFEMPLLGYFGYLPFALELFAMTHLVFGAIGKKDTQFVVRGLVVNNPEAWISPAS